MSRATYNSVLPVRTFLKEQIPVAICCAAVMLVFALANLWWIFWTLVALYPVSVVQTYLIMAWRLKRRRGDAT